MYVTRGIADTNNWAVCIFIRVKFKSNVIGMYILWSSGNTVPSVVLICAVLQCMRELLCVLSCKPICFFHLHLACSCVYKSRVPNSRSPCQKPHRRSSRFISFFANSNGSAFIRPFWSLFYMTITRHEEFLKRLCKFNKQYHATERAPAHKRALWLKSF